LNLGGIMTRGKLVRLFRSTIHRVPEPSMIQIFSIRVSIWLWTWQ